MVNPRCIFPNGIELSRLISILGSKKLLGLLWLIMMLWTSNYPGNVDKDSIYWNSMITWKAYSNLGFQTSFPSKPVHRKC